jgi:hypothetical protein
VPKKDEPAQTVPVVPERTIRPKTKHNLLSFCRPYSMRGDVLDVVVVPQQPADLHRSMLPEAYCERNTLRQAGGSSNGGGELGVEVAWQAVMQPPGERDRSFALM